MSVQGNDAYAGISRRYIRLLTITTLTVVLAIGVALVVIGQFLPLGQAYVLAANGVGAGLVASVIVYGLVSLRLDPLRQQEQMQEFVSQVNAVWYQQFQQRFEEWLPEGTFAPSETLRRDFRDSFVRLLRGSDRYDFKGGTANFTTFRLVALADHPDLHRLREIRLCLLDPRGDRVEPGRDRPLRAFGVLQLQQRHETVTNETIDNETHRIRRDIFQTVVALFDIRHRLETTLYLHCDLPWSRCEMFDRGMFLTYYQSDSPYPPAFLFSDNTRSYRTYRMNLELTREFATGVMRFGRVGPSADLVDSEEKLMRRLRELGCTDDLSDVRTELRRRFERRRQELVRAHLSPQDLF